LAESNSTFWVEFRFILIQIRNLSWLTVKYSSII
jgi:hypothetical protein